VWLLETAYGHLKEFAGIHLMRFNPDGTFVADPEGGLFSGDQALWGPYDLHGRLLTIDIEGGYGCRPGSTATARAAIRSANSLSLAWLRGGCPDAHGDVWILRRLLLDVGLPPRPPGVGPASPAKRDRRRRVRPPCPSRMAGLTTPPPVSEQRDEPAGRIRACRASLQSGTVKRSSVTGG
jgi:hypothetical protein